MTDTELADLYARCFPNDRTLWKPEAIAQLHTSRTHTIYQGFNGALFAQISGDEAEIISLFIDPTHRKQGQAQALLNRLFDDCTNQGVRSIFLEVAVDNKPALSIYRKNNFHKVGTRKGYYKYNSAKSVDAAIFCCNL